MTETQEQKIPYLSWKYDDFRVVCTKKAGAETVNVELFKGNKDLYEMKTSHDTSLLATLVLRLVEDLHKTKERLNQTLTTIVKQSPHEVPKAITAAKPETKSEEVSNDK